MTTVPTYFTTPRAFRTWLAKHHASHDEMLLGFYKTTAASKGISYQQALDEALAFGWIDGVRRRVDDERYSIRFTPRRARSIWSAVNIARVKELIAEGRMMPPGMAAYARRDETRSAIYSYERGGATLDGEQRAMFEADRMAWEFYQKQASWYRRTAAFWVVNAKKPETRQRRLATLIARSHDGERLDSLAGARAKPHRGGVT